MKLLSTCLLLTMLCVPAAETHASGLIQKLPEDGSWVRYHFDMKMDKPQVLEASGTWVVRSVGNEMVDGQQCRWIEIEMEMKVNGQKHTGVMKLLVPEKLFHKDNKGKAISKKVIRGWQKDNAGEPRKLEDIDNSGLNQLKGLLPDPARKVKKVDQKKTIAYQKGELKIDSGISVTMKDPPPQDADFKIDNSLILTVWSHDKVPFGTAEARMESEGTRGEEIFIKGAATLSIEDFGTGAKTALPDHN